jgi:hypothetical protein
MKRYTSLDFLWGCAIIGVIGFHILNQAFNKDAVIASAIDEINIPMIILAIVLVYAGTFFPLFIGLSGLVNIITIDKQWKKAIESDASDENKKKVAGRLIKTQLIRGSFLVFAGYFAESLLNGLLLSALINEGDLINKTINPLFFAQILVSIGLSVMITSVCYILLLKKGKTKQQITKIFLVISILIIIVTPLLIAILNLLPGFWNRPSTGWATRDFWLNILYFILTPLVIDFNPLFPYLSVMFLGCIIGFTISEGVIEKKFLNSVLYMSIIYFVIGALLFILEVELVIADYCMSTAGSLLVLIMVLYFVEVRGKGTKFGQKTTFFRRFGIMTLSLWCLQWFVVIPLTFVQFIVNIVTETDVAFIDGPFMTNGLDGGTLILVIFAMIMMYHLILWLWEKVNFKYSFEWITVKLMGRGSQADSRDRMDMSKTLHEVESIIDRGQEFYGRGTKIGLFGLFFLFATIYVVLTLL